MITSFESLTERRLIFQDKVIHYTFTEERGHEKMIKKINVTCEKCKENFIFTTESSIVDKVLDEGNYICFTCEDEKSEDTKND